MSILTPTQAMEALNYTDPDQMPGKVLTILSPGVDSYIMTATGFDWGTTTETYTAVDPLAILTASLLLQRWFEDSSQIGQANDLGVLSMISQLHAKYLQMSAS
jgi:hypothetical protein